MDIATFLLQYGFDLGGDSEAGWVDRWKRQFPDAWIVSALVEALYQGRYKAVSVDQLLSMWRSRGCPRLSFGLDFGRKVFPERLESIQAVCEQMASQALQIRSYNFESFEVERYPVADRTVAITPYPLRRQLRQQVVPSKLQTIMWG